MKININGVTRTMTKEEEAACLAEMERMAPEIPQPEPTLEQRLDALEGTTDDIILMMADLIGGGE